MWPKFLRIHVEYYKILDDVYEHTGIVNTHN